MRSPARRRARPPAEAVHPPARQRARHPPRTAVHSPAQGRPPAQPRVHGLTREPQRPASPERGRRGSARRTPPSAGRPRSSRSSRAPMPERVSSAAGSSSRAMSSSRCRRGEVAPVISVSAALQRSAERDSSDGTEVARLQAHPLELVGGHVAQRGVGGVAGRGDDDEVPQALEQVLDEAPRLVPGGDDPLDHPERRGAVARGDRLDQVVQQRGLRVPEQGGGTLVRELATAGAGDELVEHRQRVPDRPAARADHEGQHARGHGHALAVAELLEVRHQHVGRHQPEGVVVRAGADGADDLVRLGRREDELDVRRGLLDDLQQGVEALVRDHVRLVEDEDLVPVARGGERGALAQLTGVVDTAVAGRVDLDDVEAARVRRAPARRTSRTRRTGCRSGAPRCSARS